MNEAPWKAVRSWSALRLAGREVLIPDGCERARIAEWLDLVALVDLTATLAHEPWLDGARLWGRVEATATRLCGLSLEAFNEPIDTTIDLRIVPEGSPNAPRATAEIVLSLEEDDPPDVVSSHEIDIAAYVVEAFGLALNPFPRAVGVEFQYTDAAEEVSPFAILTSLRRNGAD